ncbi:MAG: phosphoglycerate kinase [Spirochaetales bacterium]|nr:phosphoglycerate kinase [Spirochaetales bacterium]
MNLKRLESLDVSGQKALLLFDSCQSHEKQKLDPEQIKRVIPTAQLVLDRGGSVLLCTHFQPSHQEVAQKEMMAEIISILKDLSSEIIPVLDPFTDANKIRFKNAGPGKVFLLENLAHFPDEQKGKAEFARELARLADLFIHDAPGMVLASTASNQHTGGLLPAVAGLRLQKEIDEYTRGFKQARRPVGMVLGGQNPARKIELLRKIMPSLDYLLIGGGIATTFLKGRALPIGNSSYDKTQEVTAFQILERAELDETAYLLPLDHVVAEQFSRQGKSKTVERIPDHFLAMDSGHRTVSAFEKVLKKCSTVYWNGPLGVIEFEPYQVASRNLGKFLKKTKARTVIIGEQTCQFLAQEGMLDQMGHASFYSDLPFALLSGKVPESLQPLLES